MSIHTGRPLPVGLITLSALFSAVTAAATAGQETRTLEGEISPFLGDARLKINQVFKAERFPNVVVAMDGTVLASFGSSNVRVKRRRAGQTTWDDPILIGKGIQCGGLTVDENTGDVIAFVEDAHPPAPLRIYRSRDHGLTWTSQKTVVRPDPSGNVPSMHMNEHGITLRHGRHKGRLLRPSRWYAGRNDSSLWPEHYTNAIYSDDGGKTWDTSGKFPANGTGEATLAELSDGTIYYNSRRHWAEQGANPRRRWTAISKDGGQTWNGLEFCKALPDGPQDTNYGCMAGLARLPIARRDILLYSNCDSPRGRRHGTVWASFDGGKTWPIKRLIFEGNFAYSSLTAGRPGTATEGSIYVHFEGGPKGGSAMAQFNLSWVLGGENTGNGSVPESLARKR